MSETAPALIPSAGHSPTRTVAKKKQQRAGGGGGGKTLKMTRSMQEAPVMPMSKSMAMVRSKGNMAEADANGFADATSAATGAAGTLSTSSNEAMLASHILAASRSGLTKKEDLVMPPPGAAS